MSDIPAPPIAGDVLATLRSHEGSLRDASILHLALFGSVARGEAGTESDIDLLAVLDKTRRVDLFRLVELEEHLALLLGRRVDLITAPIEKPWVRARIERDRLNAF